MSLFRVNVRAGCLTLSASSGPRDGSINLDITGTVYVQAKDSVSAKARALDVLETNDGPFLTMDNGDGVEFEAVGARALPVPKKQRARVRAKARSS